MLRIPDKFRFPFTDDRLFGVIFFITLAVPLVFFVYLQEAFESVKLPLLVVCLGAALWSLSQLKLITLKFNKILLILLLGFVGWSIVSTLFSLDVVNSILGLHGRYDSSILFYSVWAIFLILLWTSLTKDKFIYLIKTLVVVSVLISVWGILQNFGVGYYNGLEPELRPLIPSFLGNPNFNAMFTVTILPFIAVLWQRSEKFASKAYYAITSFIVIWGIIIFGSRGAFVALAAELIVLTGLVVMFRLKKRTLYQLGIFLLLALLLGIPFFLVSRPDASRNLLNSTEQTTQSRLLLWNETRRVILDSPWVGSGPGNFFIPFRITNNSAVANGEKFDDTHNLFLQIAATGGIPQLLLFLGLIGLSLWYGVSYVRSSQSLVTAAGVAATVGFIVAASFNPVVISCWLQLAIFLAGLTYNFGKDYIVKRSLGINVALKVLVIVFIIGALLFISSEYLTFRGIRDYRNQSFKSSVTWLKWASRLNPANHIAYTYLAGSSISMHLPPQQVVDTINAFVQLHPTSSGVYESAAILYYGLYKDTQDNIYKEAAYKAADKDLALRPLSSWGYYQAAYIKFKAGDFDASLQDLKHSLVLNPDQFFGWAMLGQLYLEKGQNSEAVFALKKAQALKPQEQWVRQLINKIEQNPADPTVKSQILFPEPNI